MKGLILLAAAIMLQIASHAQNGRDFIREKIQEHNECKNVAITSTNGDLMLYGKNGWAATGCPESLTNALNALNEDSELIDDVQLTEAGHWVILYGDNGVQWNEIPSSLEAKLREFNSQGEVITSVTFNDDGDWVVISKNYISASDQEIQEWLGEGTKEHGQLWAACVTPDAMVAVFAEGYQFLGNVPEDLKAALQKTELDVYRIKIAGSSWFFADIEGKYQYKM